MRLRCIWCGKSVSTELPDETIVRASLECPECFEKYDKIEVEIEHRDSPRWLSTTIKADKESVDFSTCDQDGGEHEPSFELNWLEIFEACREYAQK